MVAIHSFLIPYAASYQKAADLVPPRLLENVKMPEIEKNDDFIKWCFGHALRKPEKRPVAA